MPMTNKLTIAFTRREAELYRSHGLLEEARQLYRQGMDEAGTLGPGQWKFVRVVANVETAGERSILIAPALITREPIYARISRLKCQVELVESDDAPTA